MCLAHSFERVRSIDAGAWEERKCRRMWAEATEAMFLVNSFERVCNAFLATPPTGCCVLTELATRWEAWHDDQVL